MLSFLLILRKRDRVGTFKKNSKDTEATQFQYAFCSQMVGCPFDLHVMLQKKVCLSLSSWTVNDHIITRALALPDSNSSPVNSYLTRLLWESFVIVSAYKLLSKFKICYTIILMIMNELPNFNYAGYSTIKIFRILNCGLILRDNIEFKGS